MIKPWYKQFWPWFLIALPASVVIASLVTVSIFSKNQVSLVAEDYYKKGKGINVDLSRLNVAAENNISAMLSVSEDLATIDLNKGNLEAYPTLKIFFQHRTLAHKDITVMLNPTHSGTYTLELNEALTGPWFIEISSFDGSWLINGRANFPRADAIQLNGQK